MRSQMTFKPWYAWYRKHKKKDSLSITEEIPSSISENQELSPAQLMLLVEEEKNLGQVVDSPHIMLLINSCDLKNYMKVDSAFHYWAVG